MEFTANGDIVWTFRGGIYRMDRVSGAVSMVATGFGPNVYGIAVAPNGVIYVGDRGNPSSVKGIISVNPNTGVVSSVAVSGYTFGFGPEDLEFGPDGNLYFTDRGGDRKNAFPGVVKIDLTTGAATKLNSPGFHQANGVALSMEFNPQ